MYARQQCERKGKRIEVIHRKDMLVRAVCCLSCRFNKKKWYYQQHLRSHNATSAEKNYIIPFRPLGCVVFPAEELLKLF